jgi:hypothetical protein
LYSAHARLRLIERDIKAHEVESAMSAPPIEVSGGFETYERGRLRVIYKRDDDTIVTLYREDKPKSPKRLMREARRRARRMARMLCAGRLRDRGLISKRPDWRREAAPDWREDYRDAL